MEKITAAYIQQNTSPSLIKIAKN